VKTVFIKMAYILLFSTLSLVGSNQAFAQTFEKFVSEVGLPSDPEALQASERMSKVWPQAALFKEYQTKLLEFTREAKAKGVPFLKSQCTPAILEVLENIASAFWPKAGQDLFALDEELRQCGKGPLLEPGKRHKYKVLGFYSPALDQTYFDFSLPESARPGARADGFMVAVHEAAHRYWQFSEHRLNFLNYIAVEMHRSFDSKQSLGHKGFVGKVDYREHLALAPSLFNEAFATKVSLCAVQLMDAEKKMPETMIHAWSETAEVQEVLRDGQAHLLDVIQKIYTKNFERSVFDFVYLKPPITATGVYDIRHLIRFGFRATYKDPNPKLPVGNPIMLEWSKFDDYFGRAEVFLRTKSWESELSGYDLILSEKLMADYPPDVRSFILSPLEENGLFKVLSRAEVKKREAAIYESLSAKERKIIRQALDKNLTHLNLAKCLKAPVNTSGSRARFGVDGVHHDEDCPGVDEVNHGDDELGVDGVHHGDDPMGVDGVHHGDDPLGVDGVHHDLDFNVFGSSFPFFDEL
jgi:hypothetical protein